MDTRHGVWVDGETTRSPSLSYRERKAHSKPQREQTSMVLIMFNSERIQTKHKYPEASRKKMSYDYSLHIYT